MILVFFISIAIALGFSLYMDKQQRKELNGWMR